MDLRIPQKSLRVRLKEEKKRKGHLVFHEQVERGGEESKEIFCAVKSWRAMARILQQIRTAPHWHISQGRNPYSKREALFPRKGGTKIEEGRTTFIAAILARISRSIQQQKEALFSRSVQHQINMEIEVCTAAIWHSFRGGSYNCFDTFFYVVHTAINAIPFA